MKPVTDPLLDPKFVKPDNTRVLSSPPAAPKTLAFAESAGSSNAPPAPRRLLSILSSEERKKYPITTGVLDYFPDALALVAKVSYVGNQKHNPGQPLHWARGKSMDHEDCIGRHTIERDAVDDGIVHLANRAWRALAALQEWAEREYKLDPPRGATPLPPR